MVEEAPQVDDEVRERTERVVAELADALDASDLPWVEEYERVDLPLHSSFYEFHVSVNRERQRDLLVRLLAVEAPVHIDYAILRLVQAWGLRRTSDRSRRAALEAVRMAVRNGLVEQRDKFLWRPGQLLEVVRCPKWGDQRTVRTIQEIPPEEIDLAISKLVEASGGAMGQHLFSDVAKVLGFERVGANIQKALSARVRAAERASVGDD